MASLQLPRTLVIGKGRAYGLSIISRISNDFNVAGLCAIYPFSSLQLGVALRTLHPPVRALIVGGAYNEEEAAMARATFEAYRKEVVDHKDEYGPMSGDDGKSIFIRVHGVKKGGGAEAVAEYIKSELGQLN